MRNKLSQTYGEKKKVKRRNGTAQGLKYFLNLDYAKKKKKLMYI